MGSASISGINKIFHVRQLRSKTIRNDSVLAYVVEHQCEYRIFKEYFLLLELSCINK